MCCSGIQKHIVVDFFGIKHVNLSTRTGASTHQLTINRGSAKNQCVFVGKNVLRCTFPRHPPVNVPWERDTRIPSDIHKKIFKLQPSRANHYLRNRGVNGYKVAFPNFTNAPKNTESIENASLVV
jgi:hypothetical protein